MQDEQENSQLQHFNQTQTYLQRSVNKSQSNAMKMTQTSLLNLQTYIDETNQVVDPSQFKNFKEIKQQTLKEVVQRSKGKQNFRTFLAYIQKVYEQHQTNPNMNQITVQQNYLSICRVFLSEFSYFFLSLLSSLQLNDLNKQLTAKQYNLTIEFTAECKQNQPNQSLQFVLSLMGNPSEQDNISTLSSKEKAQQPDNKSHQNEAEERSEIEPIPSQSNDAVITPQSTLMQYLKQYVPIKHFVILFSSKQHFYLVSRTHKLGEGGFGSVFKSQLFKINKGKYMHSFWAIKELKRGIVDYQTTNHRISNDREHQMLTKIPLLSGMKKHAVKSIIQVQEVITFDDKKYIVYEFCTEKDLNKFMRMHDKLTKRHIFLIIYQLASTLALLHYQAITRYQDLQLLNTVTVDDEISQDNKTFFTQGQYQINQIGIIHRDLKLSNILVSYFSQTNIKIKLIDWAFSKKTITQKPMNRISCGTANYQAPQILNKRPYCCKVDVWAFGVVLYELLTGKQFIHKDQKQKVKKDQSFTRQRIQKMQFKSNKNYTEEEINYWSQLVSKCMQYKVDKRFTSKEVLEYVQMCPFFKPYDAAGIKFIEDLKFTKALLYEHHHSLLNFANITIIKTQIIKGIMETTQCLIQEIYQNFSSNKYWSEQTSEVKWQCNRIGLTRYRSTEKKKLCLKNCVSLLQDRFFKHYSKKDDLLKLLLKINQMYQQMTTSK